MTIYLILAVVLLVIVLAALGVLLVSMRRARMREAAGKVILNGGKSVNTEVIRENMGNGILNEHTGEFLTTVMNSQLPVKKRHGLKLTDCETGYVYQAVFLNEVVIGSMPESGVPKLVIGITGISRSHCRIYWKEGRYVVEDCHSTNHTWLNGFLLDKPFLVHTDDILQLAGSRFKVTVSAEG